MYTYVIYVMLKLKLESDMWHVKRYVTCVTNVEEMISEEDHDNDGVITKEEFVRMLTERKKK